MEQSRAVATVVVLAYRCLRYPPDQVGRDFSSYQDRCSSLVYRNRYTAAKVINKFQFTHLKAD